MGFDHRLNSVRKGKGSGGEEEAPAAGGSDPGLDGGVAGEVGATATRVSDGEQAQTRPGTGRRTGRPRGPGPPRSGPARRSRRRGRRGRPAPGGPGPSPAGPRPRRRRATPGTGRRTRRNPSPGPPRRTRPRPRGQVLGRRPEDVGDERPTPRGGERPGIRRGVELESSAGRNRRKARTSGTTPAATAQSCQSSFDTSRSRWTNRLKSGEMTRWVPARSSARLLAAMTAHPSGRTYSPAYGPG